LGPPEEPGFRLAAAAAVFRNMRAIIDCFNVTAAGSHRGCHVVVNALKGLLCGQFAIDDGLIGNHKDLIPMKGQALHGVKTSGQKYEFRPSLDIIGSIFIDDPISV
jgi:hypothetical protein